MCCVWCAVHGVLRVISVLSVVCCVVCGKHERPSTRRPKCVRPPTSPSKGLVNIIIVLPILRCIVLINNNIVTILSSSDATSGPDQRHPEISSFFLVAPHEHPTRQVM